MTVDTPLIPIDPAAENLASRTQVQSFEDTAFLESAWDALGGSVAHGSAVRGGADLSCLTLASRYGDRTYLSFNYPRALDAVRRRAGGEDPDRERDLREPAILLLSYRRSPFNAIATAGTIDTSSFFAKPFLKTLEAALRVRARQPDRHETAHAPSRAYRTFAELARMLGQSTAETAELLGLSRGTVYAWREGREPQPRNARRLYRTHTLLKTLTRRLGHDSTLHWLATGDPTPLELLAAGNFAEVDRRASPLIFNAEPAVFERVDAHIDETPDASADDAEPRPDAGTTPAPRRIRRRAPRRR
jgi:transcriptional regulator with XRE-family HTH domain